MKTILIISSLLFQQDQIEEKLTSHVITQAEEKMVVFQRVPTSLLTEIIFQMTCHKLTKANGDISVSPQQRAVQ